MKRLGEDETGTKKPDYSWSLGLGCNFLIMGNYYLFGRHLSMSIDGFYRSPIKAYT